VQLYKVQKYIIWVKLSVCGKRDLVFVWEGGVEFVNCRLLITLIVSRPDDGLIKKGRNM